MSEGGRTKGGKNMDRTGTLLSKSPIKRLFVKCDQFKFIMYITHQVEVNVDDVREQPLWLPAILLGILDLEKANLTFTDFLCKHFGLHSK